MKNYASFINENLYVQDSVTIKSNRHKYLTGEIAFVGDIGISVKLDREINGNLYYPFKFSEVEKITQEERKEYQERYFREKDQLNLINTDIDPYGEENWLGESISDFSKIKDILPSTEKMDGDIVCDPDEFLRSNETKFHYCYHPKGALADLLNQLELFGAIDIKVGGLRFKDGKIYADTLYFKNVKKDVFSEFGWDDPHGPWPEEMILLKQDIDGRSVEVNRVIDPYGEEDWLDDLPVKNEWKMKWEYDKVEEKLVLEKLGVSDIVYRTAEKIYEMYDLEKLQKMNRNWLKKRIILDTTQLEPPFNDMKLSLIFDDKYRPKKIHGGIDRHDVNVFSVYIYYTSNNVFRTLVHELDHVYQVYLKKRHFSTDKTTPSPFRKSEESPSIMSVYTQLKQRGVESKDDFITKLKKLPKYKRYTKILEDPNETPEHKRHAIKMQRKMHKLYGLFENTNTDNMENNQTSGTTTSDIKIKVEGKNYLIQQLIDNLSIVVKKRKMRSVSIKSVTGHINKGTFLSRGGYSYHTYLEITMNNKDVIVAEYNSLNNNILVKINDDIVFDLDHRTFDNEVLIDKIISQYMKYLKEKKFVLKESVNPKDDKMIDLKLIIDNMKKADVSDDRLINAALSSILVGWKVTLNPMDIDGDGDLIKSDENVTLKIKVVDFSYRTLMVTDDRGWDYYVNIDVPVIVHDVLITKKEKPKERIRWYSGGKLH